MISIREAIESIVDSDYVASSALSRGVMNLSSYARDIEKKVEHYTKKEVDVQSIVVALSRIQKGRKKAVVPHTVAVSQLAVQSPIVQLVYPRTGESTKALVQALSAVEARTDTFISVSTSTKDIAILVSEDAESAVRDSFTHPTVVYKKGLSAISVRFDDRLVREANVGLELLSRLASKRVVLDAALTTYNEFTLVMETKYLTAAMSALSPAASY